MRIPITDLEQLLRILAAVLPYGPRKRGKLLAQRLEVLRGAIRLRKFLFYHIKLLRGGAKPQLAYGQRVYQRYRPVYGLRIHAYRGIKVRQPAIGFLIL